MKITKAPTYRRKAKKLITARDERVIINDLTVTPELGDVIRGAHGIRKARFAMPSRGIGKRAGLRVIYYYHVPGEAIILLDAYSKAQRESLSDTQMQKLYTVLQAELSNDG